MDHSYFTLFSPNNDGAKFVNETDKWIKAKNSGKAVISFQSLNYDFIYLAYLVIKEPQLVIQNTHYKSFLRCRHTATVYNI